MDTFATILTLIAGSWAIYQLSVNRRVVIVQDKKHEIIKQDGEIFTRFLFLKNIAKNRVCHGKIDGKSVFILSLFIWLFLNVGNVLAFFPKANVWQFDRRFRALNLPLEGNWQNIGLVSFAWNSKNSFATVGFYIVYIPLVIANLNKLSQVLFPHSEKARLVEDVILDDKDLPDNYKSILQLDTRRVRVCYTGHSVSGDVFVNKKREISEGVGHEVDIQLGNYGEVYITFLSLHRQVKPKGEWRQQEHRLVLERPEDSEYEGYTYAFRTHNALVPDELKIGHCSDPQETLKTYARGHSNVRFILLVPESKYFNEKLVKNTLDRANLKLPSADDRKGGGEFYRECDKLYRILKTMLNRLPAETLKMSVIPEGIEEAFADVD